MAVQCVTYTSRRGGFLYQVTGILEKPCREQGPGAWLAQTGKTRKREKLAGCVEMDDLIRVHFFADLQQQMGVCFFQFCPGLRNAIDLGKESTFLERLGAAKDFHLRLFLLQRLVPANQGRPVLVKQIIHTFLLLGPQME